MKSSIRMRQPVIQLQGNPDNPETYRYCRSNNPCEKVLCQIRKTTKKPPFGDHSLFMPGGGELARIRGGHANFRTVRGGGGHEEIAVQEEGAV